jgi:hypothetical protein
MRNRRNDLKRLNLNQRKPNSFFDPMQLTPNSQISGHSMNFRNVATIEHSPFVKNQHPNQAVSHLSVPKTRFTPSTRGSLNTLRSPNMAAFTPSPRGFNQFSFENRQHQNQLTSPLPNNTPNSMDRFGFGSRNELTSPLPNSTSNSHGRFKFGFGSRNNLESPLPNNTPNSHGRFEFNYSSNNEITSPFPVNTPDSMGRFRFSQQGIAWGSKSHHPF